MQKIKERTIIMTSSAGSRNVVDRFGMASSLPPQMPVSGSTTHGPNMAEVLPRLAQETELQKMLADEKMRSEQHKTNYQTLKAEHTRLQDEYVCLQDELRSTIEESKLVQEKYKGLMDQLRKDCSVRQTEIEELRSQTFTSQKIDLLKLQVTEEVEQPYKEKFMHLDEEVEKYRSEYNKMKYEYSFLKSEYEHDRQENQRVVEEMKMRHEAEVSNLRREREALIARQQTDSSGDGQRTRVLQRENAQLHLKVKGLLTELEEIRSQREQLGMTSDSVSRIQAKQLAENAANLKAIETERESLKLQCSNLQRELAATTGLHTQLTGRIHDLEKDNITLKNRSEEVTHKSRVDMTNLKMDMLKERGDLERERDRLANEMEGLKTEIELLKQTVDQQGRALVDKERDTATRVQAAREDEWQKLHTLTQEKLELETKLQEFDRRRIDEESQRHAEKEKMEERLRTSSEAKETAEKEALVLRTKVQHQQVVSEQLDRERSDNMAMKSRLQRIESQYNSYLNSEHELLDTNTRLKRQAEELTEDLRKTKELLKHSKDEGDKLLAENKAVWVEDKLTLQQRINDLEDQLTQITTRFDTAVASHRKKKKKFNAIVTKLKHKVTLFHAKLEEMKIEKEALKRAVPTDVHLQMKKQLRDMVQRHRQFRTILLTSANDTSGVAEKSLAGSVAMDRSVPNWSIADAQHHKDVEYLKERLDLLDDHQRHQMAELKGAAPLSRADPPPPPPLSLSDLGDKPELEDS